MMSLLENLLLSLLVKDFYIAVYAVCIGMRSVASSVPVCLTALALSQQPHVQTSRNVNCIAAARSSSDVIM